MVFDDVRTGIWSTKVMVGSDKLLSNGKNGPKTVI